MTHHLPALALAVGTVLLVQFASAQPPDQARVLKTGDVNKDGKFSCWWIIATSASAEFPYRM
jgi:hypothetical protein